MKTRIISERDLGPAVEIILKDGIVAVPTETVYGLCGNGLSEKAVAKIYEIKGRPEIKPLSLMVASASEMSKYCAEVPRAAWLLAGRFWPGPLTLVLEAGEAVPEIVRAGRKTVGLRCPRNSAALKLLSLCGLPLAGPSANPSGLEGAVSLQQVLDYFDGQIQGVIDSAAGGDGVASTVLDLTKTPYRVLRQGAVSLDEIQGALVGGMMIIGITGGTGSGKTTALKVLESMGALTVDCDEVYHELLLGDRALLEELQARFPGVVKGGRLDRKELGVRVFSDAAALADLNQITHKYVGGEVDRRIGDWALMGGQVAAIDAIALIQSGISGKCGYVVGVTAPTETRVQRLMLRENVSEEYARLRIAAQESDSFYHEHCDHVLDNGAGRGEFEKKCEALFRRLLSEEMENKND